MTMLELRSVTHRFTEENVLEDVDLELERGDNCAVVGPNGAGKTTLIRIAAGLLEPNEGDVRLEGTPIQTMERREIARSRTLLRQATPQTFGFTALEVVLMGFHARTGRFSLAGSERRERALEAMERLEIAHLANRPAPVLSGGELQRVLMARTMVTETPIWLLDEPTAHLDFRHRLTLLEQVEAHHSKEGCVLAAIHDLTVVERFFDRVVVLERGEVAAMGDAGETLTADLLSMVFDVEMRRGTVQGQSVWIAVER